MILQYKLTNGYLFSKIVSHTQLTNMHCIVREVIWADQVQGLHLTDPICIYTDIYIPKCNPKCEVPIWVLGDPDPERDFQCQNWNSAKRGSNIYMLVPILILSGIIYTDMPF
jgi:hypothetical protein